MVIDLTLYHKFHFRDPRFTDESLNFNIFLKNIFPLPVSDTIEAIRNRSETMHIKVNEKLTGTFDGIEEERKVSITNAGTIQISNSRNKDILSDKNLKNMF